MSDETPRLKLPQLVSQQEMTNVTWNEALAALDGLVDLCLKGQFVDTPPSSPADGDAYLTGGAPSGAWSGQAYKIATCLDGGWRFHIPFNGLRAFVVPALTVIVYLNGVWTAVGSADFATKSGAETLTNKSIDAAQLTGTVPVARFANGSGASATTFLRGDGTWSAPSGNVAGPASAVSGNIASFNGTTGKLIQDGGLAASSLVTLTGTQTLSNKTFSGGTNFPSGVVSAAGFVGIGTQTITEVPLQIVYNAATWDTSWYNSQAGLAFLTPDPELRLVGDSGGSGGAQIALIEMHNNTLADAWGLLRKTTNGTGDGSLRLTYGSSANIGINSSIVVFNRSGAVTPGADNAQSCGSASLRWSVIYAGTGSINTSGAAVKTDIRPLDAAEMRVARRLSENVRLFRFVDAVARKGAEARLHAGMIFEEVTAAFAAEGLDAMRYGMVCRDPAMKTVTVTATGADDREEAVETRQPDLDDSGAPKYVVGLRYDELAQFILAGLSARIAALEAA